MKNPHEVRDLEIAAGLIIQTLVGAKFSRKLIWEKYRCGSTSDKESEIHVISDKNPVFDILICNN